MRLLTACNLHQGLMSCVDYSGCNITFVGLYIDSDPQ